MNMDADELLAEAVAQLAGANNVQGLNDRDKIVFLQIAVAQGTVRKKAWDKLRKKLHNARDSRSRPDLSHAQLVETLRSIYPGDKVQGKLWKKQGLTHSSPEKTSALVFHVRSTELVYEMEGHGPTGLVSEDLLPA